ncbi:hypothetical protein [Lacimicrobium sp. SS2-24]|uniref:hypothetical protein n=1 Tax=Lacimicrobium sp. SS2-24 TaxID=2005569 RepID=UPI0011325905|nr:hypothetical protein [Lacimicrobium sp. SS2-24]
MKRVLCTTALLCLSLTGQVFAEAPQPLPADDKTIDFIEKQVEQNMSVGRAIKAIVSHYPQDVEIVISTALALYPDQYREIVHAAISAQPALTEDVVSIAIETYPQHCAKIVEAAINAEPSYIDFVVNTATHATPEELQDIVRIAVVTEPNSADTIVRSVAEAQPNRLAEIITTAISAVPLVGEYIVEALLVSYPQSTETVITTAFKESSVEDNSLLRILAAARGAGIKDDVLKVYAHNGGITDEDFASLMAKLDDQ